MSSPRPESTDALVDAVERHLAAEIAECVGVADTRSETTDLEAEVARLHEALSMAAEDKVRRECACCIVIVELTAPSLNSEDLRSEWPQSVRREVNAQPNSSRC